MLRHAASGLVGADERGVGGDGEQLLVGAGRGDAAVVEEEHPVGEGDGGHPVGDDDRGGGHPVAQPVEDGPLHGGVDGRGGVVEQQQPRAAQERAGERDPLPLAARQRDAALADHLVEPAGQPLDEACGRGRRRGRPRARRR